MGKTFYFDENKAFRVAEKLCRILVLVMTGLIKCHLLTVYYYLIVKPTHAHFQFLFIKIYLKFLKILLHVSVIRPSSGSF